MSQVRGSACMCSTPRASDRPSSPASSPTVPSASRTPASRARRSSLLSPFAPRTAARGLTRLGNGLERRRAPGSIPASSLAADSAAGKYTFPVAKGEPESCGEVNLYRVGADYEAKALAAIKQQLAKSGVRLAQVLRADPSWKEVYSGKVERLFTRRESNQAALAP